MRRDLVAPTSSIYDSSRPASADSATNEHKSSQTDSIDAVEGPKPAGFDAETFNAFVGEDVAQHVLQALQDASSGGHAKGHQHVFGRVVEEHRRLKAYPRCICTQEEHDGILHSPLRRDKTQGRSLHLHHQKSVRSGRRLSAPRRVNDTSGPSVLQHGRRKAAITYLHMVKLYG